MAKNDRLFYEKKYWRAGFDIVVGVDEAGRGPLAGPVAAAAVALTGKHRSGRRIEYLLSQVKDSKKLAAKKREDIFQSLTAGGEIVWGCAMVPETTIDQINILEASKAAMMLAVADLSIRLEGGLKKHKTCCLLDGNFSVKIPYRQESIVGGDSKVFSISAASIIAKVARDRFMVEIDAKYPGYGFARHKGYATAFHRGALARLGPCPAHRKSFAPVARHFCLD